MRYAGIALLAAGLLLFSETTGMAADADAGTAPPRRSDAQECVFPASPERRLAACNAVLAKLQLQASDAALVRYDRGLAEVDLKSLDAALADFGAAIELRADFWPAHWVRAEVLMSRRAYAQAAADWTEVINRNPEMLAPYGKRATALDNQGRNAEALADYSVTIDRAGAKGPTAGEYLDRAVAYEGLGQYDRALADLGKAIQKDAQSFGAHAARGRIAYLDGKDEMALADLNKAASLHPSETYYLLWRYLVETRLHKDATEELRRAAATVNLQDWPGPIIQVVLGDIAPEQVKPPPFPANWTEADRARGANCELSFYRGEVLLLHGERKQAAALFRAAVDTGITEYIEFRAARTELKRLDQP